MMKILFVGLGNLGSQVFDLFVLQAKKGDQFLIGGRNLDYLRERTNWTAAAAFQLGLSVDIETAYMDVWKSDQTAQTISSFKPDVIFSSMTALPSSIISKLPPPLFEKLSHARGGPWLPPTLALVYKLMQAVKQTGMAIPVLNGGTPDNSHEVLATVGLAPTTGIGNIALTIPPMKKALAQQLQAPKEHIDILFFAHSYVIQSMREGTTGGAPFHLTVLLNKEDVTPQIDLLPLLKTLPLTLKHEYTQLLTAATARTVFDLLTTDTSTVVHAPGPNGLPGGYPIQKGNQGLEVVLPDGFTLGQMTSINQEGQRFDGIEKIEPDGTVYFAEKNMSILKDVLGYECRQMKLSDVGEWANELQAKYRALVKKYT